MKTRSFATLVAFTFCFYAATSFAQTTNLTDPQIASIAVVANQVDIQAGQLAKDKSKNAEVQNFANTMISDHQSVIDAATALVKKLNVTPENNDVSKKLMADAKQTRQQLAAKSGEEFDKAYIDNEVAYHKAVISTVQDKLIPEAKNEQLRNLLQSVLPTLKTHLEHAEMIQKDLK